MGRETETETSANITNENAMGIPLLNHFRDAVDVAMAWASDQTIELKEQFTPAVEDKSPAVSDGFHLFAFLESIGIKNPWKKMAEADDIKTIPETLVNQEATGYKYSAEVEMAQMNLDILLKELGHDNALGKPGADGLYGPLTQNAVMIYQESINVTPTGTITPELFEKMQTDILALGKDGLKPATEQDLSSYESLASKALDITSNTLSYMGNAFIGSAHASFSQDMRPIHERAVEGGVRVTSKFGMRDHPDDSGVKLHKGIDLAPADKDANPNPNINAITDGTVIRSYNSKSFGHTVVLNAGNGFTVTMAHLAEASPLKEGDKISAGDTIGRMGNTGHSFGTHLHLQTEYKGQAFDPAEFDKRLGQAEINFTTSPAALAPA